MAAWDRLSGRADVTFYNDHVTGDTLIKRLQPYTILVVMRERTPLPRTLISRLPNLRLIVTAGWRNRAIDLTACRDHGVIVCGTEAGSSPTAELAFGLILALTRHVVAEDRALREGRWQTKLGFALKGKKLGILGLGRLGGQVATYAQAFGMELIAWSQNLTDARAAELGCRRVDKDTLFRTADVVSLHLLLSERSRGIVGTRELALMKPGAFIVNTARAALIDQDALVAALKAGTIAGAALDVYDQEPLPPDASILTAPNTILTPHLGYATSDSYQTYFPQILEDIEAWLAGEPVRVIGEATV